MNRQLPAYIKVKMETKTPSFYILGSDLDIHGYGPEHLDLHGHLVVDDEDFMKICRKQILLHKERENAN